MPNFWHMNSAESRPRSGVSMISGEFSGLPVIDAKPKCKKAMCDRGEAFTYLEPEGLVTPRSTPDIECVVALVDQWYLKYGAEEWQAAVAKHLETLDCFNQQVARAFKDADCVLIAC